MATPTRLNRRTAESDGGESLVLRYLPFSAGFLTFVCLAAAGGVLMVPRHAPMDSAVLLGASGTMAALALVLGWYMTVRIVVDADGLERRRLFQSPARLAWVDVDRVSTWLGCVIRLSGRDGRTTIRVTSDLSGFAAFLDLLESRPEYERWTRPEADPDGLVPGLATIFPRRLPSFVAGVVAIGIGTLVAVFVRDPALFQGARGQDPRTELFNLAFIDHPILGQLFLGALALAAASVALTCWHTLRVEHDAIELESLARTTSIPLDEVVGVETRIDRDPVFRKAQSFDHVLIVRLAGGEVRKLLRGAQARPGREAIERALASRREIRVRSSVLPGTTTGHGGAT